MINLLPSEEKRQLTAARTNALLMRYVILLPIVSLIILLEMGALFIIMSATQATNQQNIADNEAQAANYADVKREAADYENNLSTAKAILNLQIPYTKLLAAIAQQLPNGASLTQLDLDAATFAQPTTITMRVQSYDQAVEIKNNLQKTKLDSKLVFSDAKLDSISHKVDQDSDQFEAVYNVTYSKEILP